MVLDLVFFVGVMFCKMLWLVRRRGSSRLFSHALEWFEGYTYWEKVVNIDCHFSLMQIGRVARRRAALITLMARWSHCVRVVSEGAVSRRKIKWRLGITTPRKLMAKILKSFKPLKGQWRRR